jgi:predicted alpha/beta-fold hydrolase
MPERDRNNIFRPLPFLANTHIQTLAGFWLKGKPYPYPSEVRFVTMPDGDQLALHDSKPPKWQPGDPIVLLIHGLGGDHQSRYVQRTAVLLYERGLRAVRMDLRGSGASFGRTRSFYHAGRTGDLRAAFQELHTWCAQSPLFAVGFSLGGHLLLRTAGEPEGASIQNLERLVSVAPPLDLFRCWRMMAQPNRRIYDRFFANLMASHARAWCERFPDPPLPEFPERLTLQQFDDLFTAPRNGFASAIDYYVRCSSYPFVPRIAVPTFILTARDDPFIAVESFEELQVPDHIEIEIQAHGGHLGFLGYDGSGGVRWMERRVVRWLVDDDK